MHRDFILIENVHVHEGFSSGIISKVAYFMTKRNIYKIPLESLGATALSTTKTEYLNTESLLNDISEKLDKSETVDSIEKFLSSQISGDWIYNVNSLETFSVQVGFWLFGKVVIKPKGESPQTLNIQSKNKRLEIKEFYNL